MFPDRRAVPFLMFFFAALPLFSAESIETVALSLRQFANMALQNSLQIRSAEESLASNKYGWMATRRSLTWPSLTASASETKEGSNTDTGTKAETNTHEGSLSLSQPMLTGTILSLDGTWTRAQTETDALGAITHSRTSYEPVWSAGIKQPIFVFTGNESLRSRRQANLQWESDQDSYMRNRLNLEFQARTLYYSLMLQLETTEVQRRKYDSSKLVTDTTRALVRAGKLAEVEMIRADINSRKDERAIQNAESDLEKAMNQAKNLISMPSNQGIRLTSTLVYEPFMIALETIIKAAIENNPDVRSARRTVELADISLHRTREGDNPQLNAIGTYSLTHDRSDPSAPIDPTGWTAKIGMDWPIIDASQTKLRTRQAELSLSSARRNYETQVRDLEVSVKNAFVEIERVEQQILDFAPQKESAARNVQAIRLQYRNGLTRLTDVFDAENQRRDLDLEYLNLLVAFNTARDQLKVLVGTDLDTLSKRTTK